MYTTSFLKAAKTLFLLLGISVFTVSFSQDNAVFFDSEYNNCLKEEASYFRLMFWYDSVTVGVRDYFISGKPKAIGFSLAIPELWHYKKEGIYTTYYENASVKGTAMYKDGSKMGIEKLYFENGQLYKLLRYSNDPKAEPAVWQVYREDGTKLVNEGNGQSEEIDKERELKEIGEYQNGHRWGKWQGFYDDGNIWYQEDYEKGSLTKGISYDTYGNLYNYTELEKQPEFKGGVKRMYQFINRNIEYPDALHKLGIGGKVYVKFTVEKDGTIYLAKILNKSNPLFETEALRVVKLMSGKWDPGLQRGQPVRVWFTMPISFSLN